MKIVVTPRSNSYIRSLAFECFNIALVIVMVHNLTTVFFINDVSSALWPFIPLPFPSASAATTSTTTAGADGAGASAAAGGGGGASAAGGGASATSGGASGGGGANAAGRTVALHVDSIQLQ